MYENKFTTVDFENQEGNIRRRVEGNAWCNLLQFWPYMYNKSFIDQACSVKMAAYWPRSVLRFYGPRHRLRP